MGELVGFPKDRSWLKTPHLPATLAEGLQLEEAIEELLDQRGAAFTTEIGVFVSKPVDDARRVLKAMERARRIRSTLMRHEAGLELQWFLPGYAPAPLPPTPWHLRKPRGPDDPPPEPTFPGAAAMRAGRR